MSAPPPTDPPTWPELDEPAGETTPATPVSPSASWSTWGPGPRNGLGTAALVLGILAVVLGVSVVGGVVLGALALVFGVIGLRRARRGEATNRGQALAGTILGAVGVVVAIVVVVVLLVAGVNPLRPVAATGSGTRGDRAALQQCVQQAHGQRAAIRACRQQFGAQRRAGTTT